MVLEEILMCTVAADSHTTQDHLQEDHHTGVETLRQDIHKVDSLHIITETTQLGAVAEVADTFTVTEAHKEDKGA